MVLKDVGLRGRKVTVLGFAREGVDLARFLVEAGAHVQVSDLRGPEELASSIASVEGLPIRFLLGRHPREEVLDAAILFVSPGVPQELDVIQEARRRGIEVSSGTRLFFQLCPAPIVGITGSSGKSTTTALVGEILREDGRHVLVGGNIGVPLLGRLREITPSSWVVLELSSFQLETLDMSPHVSTITNISPNHLDRHGSMERYVAAKERILLFQKPGDVGVLNADDPGSKAFRPMAARVEFSMRGRVHGAYLDGDRMVLDLDGRARTVCGVSDVLLRGRHNLANVLAACATAGAVGASPESMVRAIRRFRGLDHRLQLVGEIDGVQYYNDSIATSPDRAIAGLLAFDEPVVLIAGGRDKHLPMEEWAAVMCQRVRSLVLIGEATPKILTALQQVRGPSGPTVHTAEDMAHAVKLARQLSRPGDVVLLSPGCTSFDMFRDFAERGEVFARCVRQLTDAPENV